MASLRPGFANVIALAAVLAASGLAELTLQRVVYRVGVHIPRSGAFLQAYQLATWSGDLAFRVTAIFLGLTAIILAFYLAFGRRPVAGLFLILVLIGNLASWPLKLEIGPVLATGGLVAGLAWIAGEALVARKPGGLKTAITLSAVALILGQYRRGFEILGVEPQAVGVVQTGAELAVLAAATTLAFSAARSRLAVAPVIAGAAVTLLLSGSYAREPSTVAIVAMWSTGVTMSLPGILYLAAFGAFVFAAVTWIGRPRTAHVGIGLVLLFVGGLEPQVLHHGLTALVGLVLLSFGVSPEADGNRPSFSSPAEAQRRT